MLTGFITRLRTLLRRADTDAELDEEMRYHLEREIERNVANGMSADAARVAARRAFGNVTVATERARDAWRWTRLEEVRQDCLYALRTFRRAPWFVATVIATIGVGLGLLSAAFTFFDAYVLRPLPVRDPLSLYSLHWTSSTGLAHRFTWKQFERLTREKTVFVEAQAYVSEINVRMNARSAQGQLVTGNYFDMLGVPPALGRTFGPVDAAAEGSSPVLVLSHPGWLRMFGADSGVIGRRVNVKGVSFEIVGVAREDFGGLTMTPYDFWAPVTMSAALGRQSLRGGAEVVGIVARLAPRVTPARATVWLRDWLRAETADRPVAERAQEAALLSRATSFTSRAQAIVIFAPVIVAFFLVMLIACANVANIMLARGMARQREIGIRLALGAGRSRIIRQLLAESLLLAVPAGVLGLLLSQATLWAAVNLLYATLPSDSADFVRLMPLDADLRVVGFAMGAVLLAAVAFGLTPALQASRPNIVQTSRGDFDTAFRPSRLRNALVVGQVTMSVLLLVVAGVLLSASRDLARLDPGLRAAGIVQLQLFDPFGARGLDALRSDSRVHDVATASSGIIDPCCRRLALRAPEGRMERVNYFSVSANWLSVLGIPIVRGRAFTDEEARSRAPVAIISQSTAQRFWPGEDPIGRPLSMSPDDPDYGRLTGLHHVRVIGVSRDAASGWIGLGTALPVAYFPQASDENAIEVIARVSGSGARARSTVEQVLAAVDSSAIADIHALDDVLVVQSYPFRAMYWVASALGVIALALTFIGVYGVIAYLVAQRRREFGIRLALGAARGSLLRLVIGQSMRLAAVGVFFGVVLALGVSRLFASLVIGLDTYDVRGYVLGASLVLAACAVAAFGPSHRAATIDPVEALRADS